MTLSASILLVDDDRHLVDDARHVRQQFANPSAVVSVLFELEHRRDDGERFLTRCHAGDPLAAANL